MNGSHRRGPVHEPGGRTPLGPGSISLRLYPCDDPRATTVVDELVTQAALGEQAGFDGVMTSEHHGGRAGYLPNPLQAAGWALEATQRAWAAACPLLLPLRPVALVAEEVAWQAARYPGRVGVGVAAGSLAEDFEIMGLSMEDLGGRFAAALALLAQALGGRAEGLLGADRALAGCGASPVPLVSAAMSLGAVRRAARVGAGLLFDSLTTPSRVRQLVEAYRNAGGQGTTILIRRAWVGPPPSSQTARQVDVYRSYATTSAQVHWGNQEPVTGPDPRSVARELAEVLEASGADALNLRVQIPGVAPEAVRQQIAVLGQAAALLREELPGS